MHRATRREGQCWRSMRSQGCLHVIQQGLLLLDGSVQRLKLPHTRHTVLTLNQS